MRRIGIVVVLGLALLLGQTGLAGAFTINPASNLWDVFNNFGWSVHLNSNADITAMTPYETLLPGTYIINRNMVGQYAEYKNALYSQTAGYSPVSGANGIFNNLSPVLSYVADGPSNGYHIDLRTLTLAIPFCFADDPDGSGVNVRYTKWSYNVPMDGQSNGFIFLDPNLVASGTYAGYYHLIVAFEDMNLSDYGCHGTSDMDYNDLVLNIYTTDNPIPIPATLPLLGSGLLALAGLGWWRRKS